MTDSVLTPRITQIHPTAIIDPSARLDVGVTVEPFAVIEGGVTIGSGTVIESHVRIGPGTHLGCDVRIHHGAAVGTAPQDLKYAGEETELIVGDRTVIRECATVNRGTMATGKTVVGSDCLIMTYAHVAHDCSIGNHVILANAVQLGGHVTLGDWVVIGGVTPVHQFCFVGQHAMVGGGFRVTQDVMPYVVCGGYPLKTLSLNRIGLARRGFTPVQLEQLEKMFRIVFRSKLNLSQATVELESAMPDCAEARMMCESIRRAKRGIIR